MHGFFGPGPGFSELFGRLRRPEGLLAPVDLPHAVTHRMPHGVDESIELFDGPVDRGTASDAPAVGVSDRCHDDAVPVTRDPGGDLLRLNDPGGILGC